MTDPNKYKDYRFRIQVRPDSDEAPVLNLLKNNKTEERYRLMMAIQAFWGPFAQEGKPELQTTALQSIVDLTDQILQIAMLANLPINRLNFKAEVLNLIQDMRNGGNITITTKPDNESTASNEVAKTAARPATQKRRTLFDED